MNDRKIIGDLVLIIQRFEREGVDLSESDIKTVWRAKRSLGYGNPISTEDGTGVKIVELK